MSLEQRYLQMYPDVANDSYFGSRPLEHYRRHGQSEGRTWGAMPQPPSSPGGPSMSRPLPPLQTTTAPPMSTNTPPVRASSWQAPPMSTNTPPATYRPLAPTTSSAPPMSTSLPPIAAPTPPTLPNINGNQFVATGTAPTQQNVTQMIQQLQQAFPGMDQQSVVNVIRELQAAFPEQARQDPNALVQAAIAQFTQRGNPYIDRARQRGLEFANQRGLLNSSMAAGAAEGAAIDAATPFIQESLGITNRREAQDFQARQNAIAQGMGLQGQREGQRFQASQNAINQAMALTGQRENQAWQGYQNQLDRVQGVNNALLGNQLAERQAMLADYYSRGQMTLDGQIRQRLQADNASQQDWINDRNFTREFNGTLSMMPIRNAYDMASAIQAFALAEPEVYTPQVISGMTNFFQQNMTSIMAQYFPHLVRTGG